MPTLIMFILGIAIGLYLGGKGLSIWLNNIAGSNRKE